MDSESTGRYLTQGQQDSCIDRINIEPSQFVQDLEDEPYEVRMTIIYIHECPFFILFSGINQFHSFTFNSSTN